MNGNDPKAVTSRQSLKGNSEAVRIEWRTQSGHEDESVRRRLPLQSLAGSSMIKQYLARNPKQRQITLPGPGLDRSLPKRSTNALQLVAHMYSAGVEVDVSPA